MIMFVHVVPVYGWCPWGGGHWALDMNGDMHTRLWTRGAGAKSLYQLHSVSLAGLCLHCSGRGRDWGLLRPGLWLSLGRPLTDTRLPGRARHCHHLPISSDQSSPISTSPIINTQCFLSKSGHDFSPVWMFEWAWGWKHLPTQDPSFLFRIHEYIFYHWRKTENKLSLLPIQKNIIPRIFYITSRSWH